MENCATFDCNPNARLTCSSNKLCECSGSYNAYVLTTKWCIYCPNQMIFLNGFCFKYNQFSMDWFNANDYCLSLGAELISIINKVDFTFLHNIMSSGPLPRLWVGLKSSNGFDFRWTYDNSIPNTNLKIWSSGCPDGGYPKSPCAYLGYGAEGLLDDGNCGNSFLSYCYKREQNIFFHINKFSFQNKLLNKRKRLPFNYLGSTIVFDLSQGFPGKILIKKINRYINYYQNKVK